MNTPDISKGPIFDSGYMPYFYQSGKFMLYDISHRAPKSVFFSTSVGYDFTSDIVPKSSRPRGQTVEDIVRSGYFAIPKSDPETAIISDKKNTARIGLDDVIGQIRSRHELYQKNIYELELAKCAVINSLYRHEAYHGPADSRVEYSVGKRLDELYADQREERMNLWRDISKLRLILPENAQQYLSAYRKVSILEDDKGDGP